MRRLVLFVVLIGLPVAVLALACVEEFSSFLPYDDEGFVMMSLRHVLDGRRLYDDVVIYYGPATFLLKLMLHGPWLGLPLTHDVVRFTSLVMLTLSTLAAAAGAWRSSRNIVWAVVVFSVFMLYLRAPYHREPGHPLEPIALALCLLPLAASGLDANRATRAAAAFGGLSAVAGLSKINVGVYLVVGLAAALVLIGGRLGRPRRRTAWWVLLAAALSGLLPWLVMGRHLTQPWVAAMIVLLNWSLAAALIASWGELRDAEGGSPGAGAARLLAAFAAGGLLCCAAVLGVFFARGTTVPKLIESLVGIAGRMPEAVIIPPLTRPVELASAVAASAVLVVVYVRWRAAGRPRDAMETVLGLAKFAIGILALLAASFTRDIAVLLVVPFVWLAIIALPGEFENDGGRTAAPRRARIALAFVAVLQPLQEYPVNGSQAIIGTLPAVYLGLAMLHDAGRWAAARRAASSVEYLSGGRSGPVAVLALLVPLAFVIFRLPPAVAQYRANEPLALPGTALIRLPEGQAAVYQFLTRLARTEADTIVTQPGFSSLYFWSNRPPPTLDVMCSSVWVLTDEQQAALADAAVAAERPLVLLGRRSRGSDANPGQVPLLVRRLRHDFFPVGVILHPEANIDFERYVRRGTPPPKWLDCVVWPRASQGGGSYWWYEAGPASAGRTIQRVEIVDARSGAVVADMTPRTDVGRGDGLPAAGGTGRLYFAPANPVESDGTYYARLYGAQGERPRAVPVVVTSGQD